MDYKLVLDVIVAILLAATIGYAVTLNARLNQLRKNRDELAKLVAAFNDATQRAEAGIPKLKRAAEEAGGGLQERVEKAQSLRDDLAFMIERADAMANRLEGTVRSARDLKPMPVSAPAAATASGSVAPPPRPPARPIAVTSAASVSPSDGGDDFDDERSEAERELLRALQAVR
jgi:cell division septum initiation protein DivIVA